MGNFGQTALNSLHFLKGNCAGAPCCEIFLEKFLTLCEKCVGPVNKLPEGKGGKVVFSSVRLKGMCRWMGLHFQKSF